LPYPLVRVKLYTHCPILARRAADKSALAGIKTSIQGATCDCTAGLFVCSILVKIRVFDRFSVVKNTYWTHLVTYVRNFQAVRVTDLNFLVSHSTTLAQDAQQRLAILALLPRSEHVQPAQLIEGMGYMVSQLAQCRVGHDYVGIYAALGSDFFAPRA